MQFKGSARHIVSFNGATIVLFGLVASVGFMGPNWPFLFMASLAVMVPVALLISLLLVWSNKFSFDDVRAALVKPGGRRIPYSRVKGVHIAERGSVVDVFVKQGWMHSSSLVEAVPADRAPLLREELDMRFPGHVRSRSRWASLAPVISIIGILLLSFTAAHAYLHHRYPQLNADLRFLERFSPGQKRSLPPLEYIESFGFTPPPGFRYVGEQNGELYYENRSKNQRLKVVANLVRGIFDEQALLFRRAMGVADYADLMTLVYRSRYGIIPMLLRVADLDGMDRVTIFEIGPPLRGFVSQGRRDQVEETHIVIMGERPDQEVHFFFSGPDRLAEKTLQRFITGVQLVQLQGA